MATILQFRVSQQEPEQKPRARRKRRSAQIVIFPGVRYERWAEAGAPAKAKTIVRDVLTLVD